MPEFHPLIAAGELEERLGDPDWQVIDCRFDLLDPAAGRLLWIEGHIPGAVFADLDLDLSSAVGGATGRHPLPDVATFATRLGELGVGNESSVVVYDSGNGAVASRTWWMLRWLGHARVALLDRGFAGWLDDGRRVERGETRVNPRTFVPAPNAGLLMSTDEILQAGDTVRQLNLIDARDPGRFRGEVEPIDAVAGHIPGALNVPFSENLRPDGSWKSRDELRELWMSVLGENEDSGWAVMCGSGVTACHLALSGLLAGYREPRLYVGSWSEWIRDPDRSVATGA